MADPGDEGVEDPVFGPDEGRKVISLATAFRQETRRNGAEINGAGGNGRAPMEEAPPAEESEPALAPLITYTPFNWIGRRAPKREWLVRDWITIGSATGLYGDGGAGKSLLLQQLQTSCASGVTWMGMHAAPCTSIGFFCEDPHDELMRRQEWINAAYGIDHDLAAGAIYVPRVGMNNILMTFSSKGVGEITREFSQWREYILDVRAKLAIFDTVADMFAGNEIDRGQVRQFVQTIFGKLAIDMDGAVIAAAHPSQAGMKSGEGSSGSTGWNNAFRSRMYLDLPKKADDKLGEIDASPVDDFARVLKRMKGNYAPPGGLIELHWKNGVLVPDQRDDGPRRPVEDVYLALLEIIKAEGKDLSPKPRAPTYGPTLFAMRAKDERDGYSRADFERAQVALFKDHRLVLREVTRNRKPLTIVDNQSPP